MDYVEGAKAQIEESNNSEKRLLREAKLGKSELEVQISKLNAEVTKAEANLDVKQENYERSKFLVPFNLEKIDSAEYDLKIAKKELESLKSDLNARKDLKKELFPNKKK